MLKNNKSISVKKSMFQVFDNIKTHSLHRLQAAQTERKAEVAYA
jgi:hypothetical protein